jgi:hypothetical protein
MIRHFVRLILIGSAGRSLNLDLKKDKHRLRVMLGIEGNIETGSRQCEAKEFALAAAVFDQEDGGVRHHIYREDISRECAGLKDEWWRHVIVMNNSEL